MALPQALENYRKQYRKIKLFQDVASVLHWDSEVMMPEEGREYRSSQIAAVAELTHEWMTDISFLNQIEAAKKSIGELPEWEQSVWKRELEVLMEEKEKADKLPSEFVSEFARVTNLAHAEWATAKKEKNFHSFANRLEELVQLSKKQADYFGYTTEPYDALLDSYEKGAKAAQIQILFSDLKKSLVPIVATAPKFKNPFPGVVSIDKQKKFCNRLPSLLGLTTKESRLDTSNHPFSTSLGKGDKRITTRYSETDPLSSIFGVLHETGHSLYESGLSSMPDWPTPITEFLSLGIHESQSRLWENQVGRSLPFWEFVYPILISDFGLTDKELPFKELYQYINSTEKTKIRVEADQVTYNLHIILRFEIERDLINGNIQVKDLPEIWNAKMKESFGLSIENDAEGVLQDIHWSMGAFGYFPTYTLGNLFSSQFFKKFTEEYPDSHNKFSAKGDFSDLLNWLRKNIHSKGKIYDVDTLMRDVTGESANSKYLISYLNGKIEEVTK
ncbi:carboxypeptidase M32 [Leptospira sp. 2 VSF19]|uniref:Metal-dependent carboxypeptidase n=1 Tax=Leptospira soteropolitanensis TaxID=2950025 RepID=A0AAW5VAZ1_9LEPT|nr:carboxypeptidase M32 [Leptospira soteropolitanensis]MCW7491418.1 carboxypeptidase M32 [Leptospira soteropolitanensis]MCW7499002.1 carboxypeptidase M32 [Leptospira soteropolitanensis]MCW7521406.1 carboxypeptidase M32 [Leptospira soteropolitanensis]MCW7525106.1 carboxypeptidase M32 [Leptospira soteropolitanensis]MCW7528973.1 carboxypeptidase M32 [Leptospira soteropolitanensis]